MSPGAREKCLYGGRRLRGPAAQAQLKMILYNIERVPGCSRPLIRLHEPHSPSLSDDAKGSEGLRQGKQKSQLFDLI